MLESWVEPQAKGSAFGNSSYSKSTFLCQPRVVKDTVDSPESLESESSPLPRRLAVDADGEGKRLDRFLRGRFPRLPQSLLQKLVRKRSITVNRSRTEPGARLHDGDSVELWTDLSGFDAPREVHGDRQRLSRRFAKLFRPLHEDDDIIVLDKPAGIVVHPSEGHRHGDTLLDLLREHLPERFAAGSDYRPAFTHRLDQGTSGVIVAAKNREAARAMERAFREGDEIRKVYIALAHGVIRPRKGTIQLEIGRRSKPSGPTRFWAVGGARSRVVRPDQPPTGRFRSAETRYNVTEQFKKASLLKIRLGTGRTHQIRVHLAALGHPICGDGDYGKKQANRHMAQRYGLTRPFLHAAELEILHPQTGRRLKFQSKLPFGLREVLDALRAREGAYRPDADRPEAHRPEARRRDERRRDDRRRRVHRDGS